MKGSVMMDKKLSEALNRQTGSYILPFLWVQDDTPDKFLTEIEAIEACGIREFCVESRTHDQFCRDKWWSDFSLILESAKSRGMKVWLLDDKNFPSGNANGALRNSEKYAHLRKKIIRMEHIDVLGPSPESAVILANRLKDGEKLRSIIAYKRTGKGVEVEPEPIVLTDNVLGDVVYFDIPEGVWRVCFVIESPHVREDLKRYIDMLNPDSCRLMISEIYEPHYEHFGEYFGNTFRGFFSDEPAFSNNGNTYLSMLGKPNEVYPWCAEIPEMISKKTGFSMKKVEESLPFLWIDAKSPDKSAMRIAYMDAITELYARNFSGMLGDWCRAHNVEYIGHIIEDMNCHMRMGPSAGHFFRALKGQDMSGMDIVLQQVIPGLDDMLFNYTPIEAPGDPEFFTYTICKLPSSQSHITPHMKGRAMCEIFGAYGWAEGLPMMRHLIDFTTSQGLNHYVPHAFCSIYPHDDCPPHFYARGNNPTYEHFKLLMPYLQRICHMTYEGEHIASTAVWYSAEGEWSGEKYMLPQKVSKHLLTHQIDFDFLPTDTFYDDEAYVENGKLIVSGISFNVLVIPYCEYMPKKLMNILADFAAKGLKIIFADALPSNVSSGGENMAELTKNMRAVPLDMIASTIISENEADIISTPAVPSLFYQHKKRDGKDIFMFYNNNVNSAVSTHITANGINAGMFYDAWGNKLYRADCENGFDLTLPAGESVIFISCDESELTDIAPLPKLEAMESIAPEFDISVCRSGDNEFRHHKTTSKLVSITNRDEIPLFKGKIRYSGTFNVSDPDSIDYIDLGRVGESAEVFVNGVSAGVRLNFPYRFNIAGLVKDGTNTLEIYVINNPCWTETSYDIFSKYLPIPPSGLMGPITLEHDTAK